MSTGPDTEIQDIPSATLTPLQFAYKDRCAEIKRLTEERDNLLIENDMLRNRPASDDGIVMPMFKQHCNAEHEGVCNRPDCVRLHQV